MAFSGARAALRAAVQALPLLDVYVPFSSKRPTGYGRLPQFARFAEASLRRSDRIAVVVDNDRIHQAPAVQPWLAAPPHLERLWLPADCPRAQPIERVFGDVHDKITRRRKRKRWRDRVTDVGHFQDRHGPGPYHRSTQGNRLKA
jgi:DDE superfamily endonuclease